MAANKPAPALTSPTSLLALTLHYLFQRPPICPLVRKMDRCPDEVLQLILNELSYPGAFVTVNRRLRSFSAEAYVRASYLLARHGFAEALFKALGRGDIVDGRVLEILVTAGAPASRYLVQLAVQHYHHGQVSFIPKLWVRALPFAVFVQFLALATSRFGVDFALPRKRGRDDGGIFLDWAWERWRSAGSDLEKEKRLGVARILEEWKFQPFCMKDPLVSDFALTLASEPDLLLLALRNGYRVDPMLRNFVFRQVFVGLQDCGPSPTEMEKRLSTLRGLCQLQDSSFFLSRTVAAEVLLECTENVGAYNALNTLAGEGHLQFDLPTLVVDLIKTFAHTRSVTDPASTTSICHLFSRLPASLANDPDVRHVIFVIVFSGASTAATAHARLLELGYTDLTADTARITRITPAELVAVLASPFIVSHRCIVSYARLIAQFDQDWISAILEETAARCLELSCKGNLLEELIEEQPYLKDVVSKALVDRNRLELDMLPSGEAGVRFVTSLVRPASKPPLAKTSKSLELGAITQMTLSASAALDLVIPPERSWRTQNNGPQFKRLDSSDTYADSQSSRPQDALRLETWVANTYGSRSAEAAVLAEHAVANWISPYVERWCPEEDEYYWWDTEKRERVIKSKGPLENDVPMTMKHWRILARLGEEPDLALLVRVQRGEPFYEDAEDYLLCEASRSSIPDAASTPERETKDESKEDVKTQKRLDRKAEKVRNRGIWVKALGALYREEFRAHDARRKQRGLKRAVKSKFLAVLDAHLYYWRQDAREEKVHERQRLLQEDPAAYIDVYGDIVSDGECDGRPAKRRKRND